MRNVIDLANHPILWTLLQKYMSNLEGKITNYSKKQLTALINLLIHDGKYNKIRDILMAERIPNIPVIDGFPMISDANPILEDCPLYIEIIKKNLYTEKYANYRTVEGFTAMIPWMFNHNLDSEIVEVLLIEYNPEKIALPEQGEVYLSETALTHIKSFLKYKYGEELEGFEKEDYETLAYTEYMEYKNTNRLYEIFEFQEVDEEFIKIDQQMNEEMSRKFYRKGK